LSGIGNQEFSKKFGNVCDRSIQKPFNTGNPIVMQAILTLWPNIEDNYMVWNKYVKNYLKEMTMMNSFWQRTVC
jgi:hypothetical protein